MISGAFLLKIFTCQEWAIKTADRVAQSCEIMDTVNGDS
jgi:hypothetical protein